MTHWQSDSSVLLRGGRTDHMGKEWAERLHEHSQHARGTSVPKKSVSSTLLGLKEKARREPKHRFRSLCREINLPMLYESFRDLKRNAAPGVDGLSVTDYEFFLERGHWVVEAEIKGFFDQQRFVSLTSAENSLRILP